MFQLFAFFIIIFLLLSFWVPYRKSGIQHGLISFFSVLFSLVVGILILYWLLAEKVIVINLLFGGTSKGLGFIPAILLLSSIVGYFLLRPLVIYSLKMKVGQRKKTAFLFITVLIIVIGIDFTKLSSHTPGIMGQWISQLFLFKIRSFPRLLID